MVAWNLSNLIELLSVCARFFLFSAVIVFQRMYTLLRWSRSSMRFSFQSCCLCSCIILFLLLFSAMSYSLALWTLLTVYWMGIEIGFKYRPGLVFIIGYKIYIFYLYYFQCTTHWTTSRIAIWRYTNPIPVNACNSHSISHSVTASIMVLPQSRHLSPSNNMASYNQSLSHTLTAAASPWNYYSLVILLSIYPKNIYACIRV